MKLKCQSFYVGGRYATFMVSILNDSISILKSCWLSISFAILRQVHNHLIRCIENIKIKIIKKREVHEVLLSSCYLLFNRKLILMREIIHWWLKMLVIYKSLRKIETTYSYRIKTYWKIAEKICICFVCKKNEYNILA